MADQATQGAAVSTGAGSNGTATQTQPATGGGDMVSVPRSDYDKFVRHSEQIKGFQPFLERHKAIGVQRPEDFDRLTPYLKTIQELEQRGVKHDMLGRMFSPEADADLAGDPKNPQFDPAKFEKDLEAKFERKLAVKDWESLTAKEAQYVDAALKEALGEEQVDGMSREMYRRAVANYLDELKFSQDNWYPEDHLLKGYNKPLTEEHAKKAAAWFKSERAKHAGSASTAKADAAIAAEKKGATTTAAGKTGGSGAPDRKRPGQQTEADERAQIRQNYQALKSRRNAG